MSGSLDRGWRDRWLDRFYRSRPGWRDGTEEFWALCREHVPAGARILEIGAGPANPTSAFLAGHGELWGADVDPEVRKNPHLRKAALIEGERLPFPDASFDACVSNYVLEHVASPGAHLSEVRRVLRPGGVYLFRTPNRWHYVSLASSLTPHWVHELAANRLRALASGAHDPYPTVYRLNSRAALEAQATAAGLEVVRLDFVEKEPSYGMAARPLFLALMAWERLLNASPRLAGLRANIFGVLRRAS